ncbi:MAG: TonB-dependent receptor [Caulobacteraceae bacterium]|nr:TonB-dependent receptor [Caulobacteraceae bacterium]
MVGERTLTVTATYNIDRLTELVPSLNYSSPNPRNTAFTIRGLGSSVLAVSQANDGLEPGVGFYVDQVYHARPATAAFDFLDVERVEVLRGPQGTVFGKNTTAGAINITTRAPSFAPEAQGEISYGSINYWQGKASISGPLLGDAIAARLSFVASSRDGVLTNVTTGGRNNSVNNFGFHGQILFRPVSNFSFNLSGDYNSFDSNCCTQVFVRVGTSLKPASRQYPALAAGVGYAPPSLNPYDRLTDIDAALKVDTDEGGVSGLAQWNLGPATITSVTAWRFWDWDAANDRDYTRLSIQTLQHIPSRQGQYSQELRIASNGRRSIEYVAGLYFFNQVITGEPITQYGPVATYWLLGPPPAFPADLLTGYMTDGHIRFNSSSYAAFGEVTLRATSRLSITGGLRYTEEEKDGSYAATVSGGLTDISAKLLNSKLSILRPQAYTAHNSNGSLSGRAVVSYDFTDTIMAYASYARTSKSGGINMSGLPLDANNQPAQNTAVVRPEDNTTYEIGLKTRLIGNRLLLNVDWFDTTVHDFQTNVVDTGPGALRGYLANIAEVRSRGAELDSDVIINSNLSAYLHSAWIDAKYVSYANGPCPLELTGSSTTVCDLSGRGLPGTPRWAMSAGGEYKHSLALGRTGGEAFARLEASVRTKIYGDPTDSKYTVIGGYTLVNASVGFRARHWDAWVWARNLFDENYLQNVTVQSGNSGLIIGTPGDPRTFGVTVRANY